MESNADSLFANADLFGSLPAGTVRSVRATRARPSMHGRHVARVVRAPQNFVIPHPRKGWYVIIYSPRGETLAFARARR
jgi:hypothetical protein